MKDWDGDGLRERQSGFSLIEMMVVVALIGIIAAISIPNYQRYQETARQSEAKISLLSLYTAEQSYALYSQTYTTCLSGIGYVPIGGAASLRYYEVGFSQSTAEKISCGSHASSLGPCKNLFPSTAPPSGNPCVAPVNAQQWGTGPSYPATISLNSSSSQLAQGKPPTQMDSTHFVAAASGGISSQNLVQDVWTINEQKVVQQGVPLP